MASSQKKLKAEAKKFLPKKAILALGDISGELSEAQEKKIVKALASSEKKLKADAKLLVSLPDLFPKGAPDMRRNLTPYQTKKIKAAVKVVKNIGGAYAHEITPMGRGRRAYMEGAGLPVYMRGIVLPGGAATNKNLQFVSGAVQYQRGKDKSNRRRYELHTHGTEQDLINSSKAILKVKKKGEKTAITASGRVIGSAQNLSNDAATREAVRIFNKYSDMAASGETRQRLVNGKIFECAAAHPSDWGMGILFESGGAKNATKKKAAGKGRTRK